MTPRILIDVSIKYTNTEYYPLKPNLNTVKQSHSVKNFLIKFLFFFSFLFGTICNESEYEDGRDTILSFT